MQDGARRRTWHRTVTRNAGAVRTHRPVPGERTRTGRQSAPAVAVAAVPARRRGAVRRPPRRTRHSRRPHRAWHCAARAASSSSKATRASARHVLCAKCVTTRAGAASTCCGRAATATTIARPYAPLAEALRRRADAACAAQQLAQRLGPVWLRSLARIERRITDWLPDLPEGPPLRPGEEHERIREALLRALARAGPNAPLLLVVDDVQWADSETLDVLRRARFAARRQPTARVPDRPARKNRATAKRCGTRSRPRPHVRPRPAVRRPVHGVRARRTRAPQPRCCKRAAAVLRPTARRHGRQRVVRARNLARAARSGPPRRGCRRDRRPRGDRGRRTVADHARRATGGDDARRRAVRRGDVRGRDDVAARHRSRSRDVGGRERARAGQCCSMRSTGCSSRGLLVDTEGGYAFHHEQVRSVVEDSIRPATRVEMHRRLAGRARAPATRRRRSARAPLRRRWGPRGRDSLSRGIGKPCDRPRRVPQRPAFVRRARPTLRPRPASPGSNISTCSRTTSGASTCSATVTTQADVLDRLDALAGDDVPLRAEVERRRAWWCAHCARFDEAEVAARRVLSTCTTKSATGVARARRSWRWPPHCGGRGERLRPCRRLETAIEVLDDDPTARARSALRTRARVARDAAIRASAPATRAAPGPRAKRAAIVRGEAEALGVAGVVAMEEGDTEAAEVALRDALERCRTIGYRHGEGAPAPQPGESLLFAQGASPRRSRTTTTRRSRSSNSGTAAAKQWCAPTTRGSATRFSATTTPAEREARESLDYFRSVGDRRGEAHCLDVLGASSRACRSLRRSPGVAAPRARGAAPMRRDAWLELHLQRSIALVDVAARRPRRPRSIGSTPPSRPATRPAPTNSGPVWSRCAGSSSSSSAGPTTRSRRPRDAVASLDAGGRVRVRRAVVAPPVPRSRPADPTTRRSRSKPRTTNLLRRVDGLHPEVRRPGHRPRPRTRGRSPRAHAVLNPVVQDSCGCPRAGAPTGPFAAGRRAGRGQVDRRGARRPGRLRRRRSDAAARSCASSTKRLGRARRRPSTTSPTQSAPAGPRCGVISPPCGSTASRPRPARSP